MEITNNTQPEQWRMIAQSPAYQISNLGNVRNAAQAAKALAAGESPKILAVSDNGEGYWRVTLTTGGRRLHYAINRLVAFAFLGAPENATAIVKHRNEDTLDNRLENLEWVANRVIKSRRFSADQAAAIRAAAALVPTTVLAQMHTISVAQMAKLINRQTYANVG